MYKCVLSNIGIKSSVNVTKIDISVLMACYSNTFS